MGGKETEVPRIFLTAEWRYLAMLNYRIEPALLLRYVPAGTELDDWQGQTFVSVVGFLFRNTRVLGIPIPLHRHFEELNLRLYVRRSVSGEVRRAVTFIKELVPRRAIAAIARRVYNEPYEAVAMRHRISYPVPTAEAPQQIEYAWRQRAGWGRLAVEPSGAPRPLRSGSQEEFITEHYWGYTPQRDGTTMEYQVDHPRWRVWQVGRAALEGDLTTLYGPSLARALADEPSSAFLAEGSAVTVYAPLRLPRPRPNLGRQANC